MTAMLEKALQYAGRKWRIIPLAVFRNGACSCHLGANCSPKERGKHPLIKKWQKLATTDRATIEKWWRQWPDANIGVVTGAESDLMVIDLDSMAAIEALKARGAPPTYTVLTRRGAHLYYKHPGYRWGNTTGSAGVEGLDTRGDGGYVIAPPSVHPSGHVYAVRDETALVATLPEADCLWLRNGKPPRERKEKPSGLAATINSALNTPPPLEDVLDAIRVIPNDDVNWETFNTIGMAIFASTAGSDGGRQAFHQFAVKSRKYDAADVDLRWAHYHTSPPSELTFGTLWHFAKQADPLWEPPSRRPREVPPSPLNAPDGEMLRASGENLSSVNGVNWHGGIGGGAESNKSDGSYAQMNGAHFGELPTGSPDNPLIQLNNQFCTIGDVGGKCLVLSWVPSKIDPKVKVPSFQSFKSFADRYSHRYVAVPVKKVGKNGDVAQETQHKPMGAYWLQWYGRRFYERLDMVPGAPEVLADGALNLWRGFGVTPAAGSWGLMKQHITNVLADADAQAATYIFKYAAWCVQNPGEQAGVALVFRGGKGSGKGTFANALRELFGAHGLQIYSGKHLTGQFNGHLRSCLLLFADEAFWAGDKQGESVLKGMITEKTLVIEHKGVDAEAWRNRLKIIMAANADWVVPASKDERRYAVFNVNDSRVGDREYFKAIYAELAAGGLEAMLHDLLQVKLGDWHPRDVVKTEALQEQKGHSLSPVAEWWEYSLQNGWMPFSQPSSFKANAADLLAYARQFSRRTGDLSPRALGLHLVKLGATVTHTRTGNQWELPKLADCRRAWEKVYGEWKWDETASEWQGDTSGMASSFTSGTHPSRANC